MAGVGLPHEAIAEQVRRGIDLVVHLERDAATAPAAWSRSPRSCGRRATAVRALDCSARDDRRPGPLLLSPALRRAARRGGAREAVLGEPAAAALAAAGARAAAAGPGARATRRRSGAAPAGRSSAPLAAIARRLVPGRRDGGAAAGGRRARRWPPGRSSPAAGRYRRAVERALPDVAIAVADSLTRRALAAGVAAAPLRRRSTARRRSSLRGSAPSSSSAPPTGEALAAWRRRMRSARVDAFAAALLSQRLAGGDLAGLLRRFAAGAAERDRVAEDARAATAQARFTGLLVVAMPSGGALFAELLAARVPRQGARRPGLGGPARARGRASARRLRRDPPASRRWPLEPGRRPRGARRPRCLRGRSGASGRARAGARRLGRPWRRGRARRRRCASAFPSASPAPASPPASRSRPFCSRSWRRGARWLAALALAPAAPGRLALLVALGLPAAGFFVPDALLERRARRRRRRLLGALPDALDLLAVGAAVGAQPRGRLRRDRPSRAARWPTSCG